MDIKHNYTEKGQGDWLILLHGNGEDYSVFSNQLDAFAKHFRVVALDTRGHGKTPRGDAPFTIRQFADDLAEFMDSHEIKKAHILGFSDGANIAMVFAAKHPERVDRLVLNSGNMTADGLKGYFLFPTKLLYRVYKKLGKTAKVEMLELMLDQPNVTVAELAKIKAPTLVIAGTDDLIKKEHTELIAASIHDSRLVFIKGNHAALRVNPKDFNREVLDFLTIPNDELQITN